MRRMVNSLAIDYSLEYVDCEKMLLGYGCGYWIDYLFFYGYPSFVKRFNNKC